MKSLIISALIIFGLSQTILAADGYCHEVAETAAAEAHGISHPLEDVSTARADVSGYVGFHVKRYNVVLNTDTAQATYAVDVFEYETESTDCEVDRVVETK